MRGSWVPPCAFCQWGFSHGMASDYVFRTTGPLGFTVHEVRGGMRVAIESVAPDTEAELLGVPVGGLLLAVDGQHVIGMRLPTVKKKLLEAGRPLTLTVLSDSSFKQADVETVSMAVVPAPAAPTKESLLEKGLRMRALELKEGPSLGFLVDESADASHLVIISEVLT